MLHMPAGNVHGLFELYRAWFALRCLAGWEAEEGLTTHSCSQMMAAFSLLPSLYCRSASASGSWMPRSSGWQRRRRRSGRHTPRPSKLERS